MYASPVAGNRPVGCKYSLSFLACNADTAQEVDVSEVVSGRSERWVSHRLASGAGARRHLGGADRHHRRHDTLLDAMLPHPSGWVETVVWWVVLSCLATGVLFVSDRLARRALPLAALLKLSLVFPDRARSRYQAALRTGTVHQLEQRVFEIKQRRSAR